MFKLTKKKVAAGVVAAGLVAMTGVGYAYWTQGGSGDGAATTGTTTDITVNQDATTSDLYPGASVALSGDFDNPNDGSVWVASVTASVDAFSVQPDLAKPACTADDFEITGTATVGHEIASGDGVDSWSGLSIHMFDRADDDPGDGNQDNCKGLTTDDLTISYEAHAS